MGRVLTGKEFFRWLDADPASLDSCIARITPEMAAELLRRNKKNRPITKSRVRIYSKDMLDGNFPPTSSAWGTDVDGHLQNGQHRAESLIDSGATITTLFIKGLARESFVYEDTQLTRSLSDILAILREDYPRTLAGALRWLHLYRHGESAAAKREEKSGRTAHFSGGTRKDKTTNAKMLELLDANPGLRDSVARYDHIEKRLIGPPMMAFLHYVGSATSVVATESFLTKLIDGVGMREGETVHQLARILQNGMVSRDKMHVDVKFRYCCKALGYILNDVDVEHLQLSAGEHLTLIRKWDKIPTHLRKNRSDDRRDTDPSPEEIETAKAEIRDRRKRA